MGLPAYYLVESPPDTPIELPVSYDPTSNPQFVTRDQVQLVTGRGVIFEYELSTRATPVYIFTVPASLLAAFKTMHDAVVGSAFFFVPDMDAPLPIHVRKEPNFMPESIGVFFYEGIPEQWFRYELKLFEEITAADIED